MRLNDSTHDHGAAPQAGVWPGGTLIGVTWTPSGPVTNRRFRLRVWQDCEEDRAWNVSGEDVRTVWVTVLDTPALAITNVAGGPAVTDATWIDEPAASNMLYAAEGTNGAAEFLLDFSWIPLPGMTNEP